MALSRGHDSEGYKTCLLSSPRWATASAGVIKIAVPWWELACVTAPNIEQLTYYIKFEIPLWDDSTTVHTHLAQVFVSVFLFVVKAWVNLK